MVQLQVSRLHGTLCGLRSERAGHTEDADGTCWPGLFFGSAPTHHILVHRGNMLTQSIYLTLEGLIIFGYDINIVNSRIRFSLFSLYCFRQFSINLLLIPNYNWQANWWLWALDFSYHCMGIRSLRENKHSARLSLFSYLMIGFHIHMSTKQ